MRVTDSVDGARAVSKMSEWNLNQRPPRIAWVYEFLDENVWEEWFCRRYGLDEYDEWLIRRMPPDDYQRMLKSFRQYQWRLGKRIRAKHCVHCDEPFEPKRSDAIFCSTRCRVASHRKSA